MKTTEAEKIEILRKKHAQGQHYSENEPGGRFNPKCPSCQRDQDLAVAFAKRMGGEQ